MRLRSTLSLIPVALLLLLAACGGGSGSTATPTPAALTGGIPTATPFATVPPAVIVTASAGSGSEVTYTVEPGDSLLAIAARFGSTVDAIQARNNLTGSDIYVGQELVIPNAIALDAGATATPAAQATSTPAAGGTGQVYVVQSGDTALAIALKFNTTLDALAAANGLTASDLNNLHEGQKLQIPGQ
jgi:LysM repeat protein